MKLILSLLILLTSSLAFGQVPSFKGQSDTTKIYPVNITTPNHQVTKTNSSTVLIETGNTNRLKNPGFEHSTIWTGWTTGCTGTATLYMGGSSLKYEGKQVLEFEVIGGASGGQCTIYQNAETVAVDGVVAIAIHSENASGVKVLKKTNIYDVALEKDILGKSEWQKIELVGKLGSSETGVAIEVTVGASETKEVHLDEAKVAIANTKQVVGVDTDWVSYTPTISNFTIGNGSTYAWWKRNGDSVEIRIVTKLGTTSTTSASQMTWSLPNGLIADTNKFNPTPISGNRNLANSSFWYDISAARFKTIVPTMSGPSVFSMTVEGSGDQLNNTFIPSGQEDAINAIFSVPILGWSATTEVYSTEADFFSTDTNTLTFKGTAITNSDPVGTFNTYSYAANSNTKTICGTAPTQTIASMKTNGIQIFTRVYNAASTCANPARVEVKLGKNMTNVQKQVYKNASKSVSGSLDYYIDAGGTFSRGAQIVSYDENTGVATVDVGINSSGVTTASQIRYADGDSTTSGYLVINAQPKKTTAVADFKQFDYVSEIREITSATSITTTLTTVPFPVSILSTHSNSWSGNKYCAPIKGLYSIKLRLTVEGVDDNTARFIIRKNSSTILQVATRTSLYANSIPAYSTWRTAIGDIEEPLNQGDCIEVLGDSQPSTASLSLSVGLNRLSITRIPGQF